MNRIRIALVARDGYLDLLPRIAASLRSDPECIFDFLFLCHTQTDKVYLEKKYGINDPVVMDTAIGRIQERLDFSDIVLKKYADKYNKVPLVRCLWSLRHEKNMPEREVKSQALSMFMFWEKYLSENKVDVLLYERPSILSTCISWLVCQGMNILSVDFVDLAINKMALAGSWLDDYAVCIGDKIRSMDWQKIDRKSLAYKEAESYLALMTDKPRHPELSAHIFKFTGQAASLGIPVFVKLLKSIFSAGRRSKYFSRWSFCEMLVERFKYILRYRAHRLWSHFDRDIRSDTDNFFLFPLQIRAEWSNYAIMGLEYSDPLGVIKQVCDCLPPWSKLYVKEHYSMFAERSLTFYKDLKSIRQLVLVSPEADTFELIKRSRGVVTLGATTGFEALLLDKPVVLFKGEPWYRGFPGVTRVNTANELAAVLQNPDALALMSGEEKFKYVYALFDLSFYGFKVPAPNALDQANVTNLAGALKDRCISWMEAKGT